MFRPRSRLSVLLVGVAFGVSGGLTGCTGLDDQAGSDTPNPTISVGGPCFLAFGPSCGPTPPPTGSPSAGTRDVTGQWKGTYTCGQGLTGFNLDIADEGGGAVSAVFSFGPVESNPRVPNGSYSMTGRLDSQRLTLVPEAWIERPSGYVMVGLSADLPGEDPDLLTGTVTNSACTTFSLAH